MIALKFIFSTKQTVCTCLCRQFIQVQTLSRLLIRSFLHLRYFMFKTFTLIILDMYHRFINSSFFHYLFRVIMSLLSMVYHQSCRHTFFISLLSFQTYIFHFVIHYEDLKMTFSLFGRIYWVQLRGLFVKTTRRP